MPRKKTAPTPPAEPTPSRFARPPWKCPGGIVQTDPFAPDSVAVYRVFNVAGALLYVGISDNPKRRFAQHHDEKYWWVDVARWEITWFPDRETALAEEARAIVEETPAYNLAGIPDPIDKAANRDGFLATIPLGDMPLQVLNSFFLLMVRRKSLPNWPEPRTKLGKRDTEDIYIAATEQATAWTLRRHRKFIEQWNDEQATAWHAHHPQPRRESS